MHRQERFQRRRMAREDKLSHKIERVSKKSALEEERIERSICKFLLAWRRWEEQRQENFVRQETLRKRQDARQERALRDARWQNMKRQENFVRQETLRKR